MKHFATPRFWRHYHQLPIEVREIADKNYELLKADSKYPSLHFKKIGTLWSVRIGALPRARLRQVGRRCMVLDWLTCRLRQIDFVEIA